MELTDCLSSLGASEPTVLKTKSVWLKSLQSWPNHFPTSDLHETPNNPRPSTCCPWQRCPRKDHLAEGTLGKRLCVSRTWGSWASGCRSLWFNHREGRFHSPFCGINCINNYIINNKPTTNFKPEYIVVVGAPAKHNKLDDRTTL